MSKGNAISANPMEIEWPADQYQMTQALRKEIRKAAARVQGDPQKLEVLKQTLIVGVKHAVARRDKDVELRERQVAELELQREAKEQRDDAIRKQLIAQKEAEIAALKTEGDE